MKIRVHYRSGSSGGCEFFDSFEKAVDMMRCICKKKYVRESGRAEFNMIVKISPTQEACAGEGENN